MNASCDSQQSLLLTEPNADEGIVVEEAWVFTFEELCRASGASPLDLIEMVTQGILDPAGRGPEQWLFSGPSLGTTQVTLRLANELEIGIPGAALALALLDQIRHLRAELEQALSGVTYREGMH